MGRLSYKEGRAMRIKFGGPFKIWFMAILGNGDATPAEVHIVGFADGQDSHLAGSYVELDINVNISLSKSLGHKPDIKRFIMAVTISKPLII